MGDEGRVMCGCGIDGALRGGAWELGGNRA